jgi:hypothetical protein
VLTAGAQNGEFYAVCYAEGSGDNLDNTWQDSGIRLRFIRWTNAAKYRVVSGAPMRLTFSVNMGRFDQDTDKLVLVKGGVDCVNAPNALPYSNGDAVARRFDYSCTAIGSSNVGQCDSNFDGVFSETCIVGSLCNPATGTNGGCGTGGKCEGTIQLPSGTSYDAIHDTTVHTESRMNQGFYAICLCLGTQSTAGHPTSYSGANGDGGCNTANEFTRVFSPSVPGRTLKIISKPRLGRYLELHGQQTVRHVSGSSHKYHIKATSTSAGFQIADSDKIYFMPSGIGCGQLTKYSGAGTHVYDHATNAYISTGVDRR